MPMTDSELRDRLTEAVRLEDAQLTCALYEIVEELERVGAGMPAVRTILAFMEDHPEVDFGVPGPLVHFVEGIDGYQAELHASLARRPVAHTVWMLHRILNVTETIGERERLLMLLEAAGAHPRADEDARRSVERFMKYQGR
jgi:hypothetical protein